MYKTTTQRIGLVQNTDLIIISLNTAIVLAMFMLSYIDPVIVLAMFMLSFIHLAIVLAMFMLSFIKHCYCTGHVYVVIH